MKQETRSYNITYPLDYWRRLRDLITEGKVKSQTQFFLDAIEHELERKEAGINELVEALEEIACPNTPLTGEDAYRFSAIAEQALAKAKEV